MAETREIPFDPPLTRSNTHSKSPVWRDGARLGSDVDGAVPRTRIIKLRRTLREALGVVAEVREIPLHPFLERLLAVQPVHFLST